jgi:hypothetical protein
MQIHELNRSRRTDEGIMDVVKGVGGAAKTALATAAGIDPNAGAASAGILDPEQKLAAVMKEPAMVKLATQYADEWLKTQAQAVPEALSAKDFMADAPPAMQKQLQQKLQNLTPATTPPGQPVNTTTPTTPTTATTAVTNPAKTKYLKDFLEFANEKIAMRDPTTYKMIGLTSLYTADQKYSLKTELDAAKKEVIKAQGDPVATKEAVKNYILTALAAAQLMLSGNKVAAATPQAPALGRQTPAAGKTGAGATTTPTTGSNAVALITQAGLPAATLAKAGQFIQTNTGNKQLSTTGDSVIDTMLEGMGYTVS